MDVLRLRFDAPLMSFGGPVVDNRGITRPYPSQSMLTGLLANALGWEHGDFDRLGQLQARLRFGARCDVPGELVTDFQTVDLSQSFLKGGWTARGEPEGRSGGSAREGTHIRYRDYLADAVYTVAVTLIPPEDSPTIDDLQAALAEPARPLFIGRKPCMPSLPLFIDRVSADSLAEAAEQAPRSGRASTGERLTLWWPAAEGPRDDSQLMAVVDERDWANQIHAGRRWMYEGRTRA